MAAPRFVASGLGATDAGGAWSYNPFVSTYSVGDIVIAQILQDGSTNGAVAVTGATFVENLAGTDNAWTQIVGPNGDGSFPVGGSGEARQFLYIGRALSTSNAPTISGTNSTSEDLYIRMYFVTDVNTGTTLATVIENGTAGSTVNEVGTSATASDAGVTTLGPDRLPLNFVAINDDNIVEGFPLSGVTGGDWASSTEYAESSGTDGYIGIFRGILSDIASIGFVSNLPIYGESGTSERLAQSFQLSSARTGVNLELGIGRTVAAPTDNVVVEIQTDSGGAPSGTVVGTSVSQPASYVDVSGNFKLFETNASLSASTTYWIVVRRDGARDTTNYYNWVQSTESNNASGVPSTRDSGSWTNGTIDFRVRVIPTYPSGSTINGGTCSITDSDAWGVVGFALIGTTVVSDVFMPDWTVASGIARY